MQPIFSRNADIDKIAFLNWRIDDGNDILNLLNMAEGFLLGAIKLARVYQIENLDKTLDIVIFPILTNANHGIELYLKGLTWMLNKLMADEKKIEGSHNIQQIYTTVRSKIKKYGGLISLHDFDEAMIDLKNYIDELFSQIGSNGNRDRMDFSRYPFDVKYENHFYVERIGNVEIDIDNFIVRFENILAKLESLADTLYHIELNGD